MTAPTTLYPRAISHPEHPRHDEYMEARRMVRALGEVLRRTGRYNLCALERSLAATDHPVSRRTLVRWFHGHAAPLRIDDVERVAHAAGVDLAYLLPEVRR